MTRETAEQTYRNLAAKAKLTIKELNALVTPRLNGSKTPVDYVRVARQVVAELLVEDDVPFAEAPTEETTPAESLVTQKILVLPPSVIVAHSIQVPGEVHYQNVSEDTTSSEDFEGTKVQETLKTTRRTVKNPTEEKAAKELAGSLRHELNKLGQVLTSGALLVPLEKRGTLREKIEEVRTKAREFNEKARHHFVRLAITGPIQLASDDEQTARDLAFTMQEMMSDMKRALEEANVEKIRQLATQAQSYAKILPEREATVLRQAIIDARSNATFIKEQITKKQRLIEEVREEIDSSTIDRARMMFLEYAVPMEMAAARSSVEVARFEELTGAETGTVATPQVSVDTSRFTDLE